jgi:chemosensory pili system protein ChpA (sensor histidine kinase/response regulator)
MSARIDKETLAGLIEEVRGYIPKIRRNFEILRNTPDHADAMEEAHRLVHSIKGAASMAGLSSLGHIAYFAEEAIEETASGQLEWNAQTTAVLSRTLALIELYMEQVATGSLRDRPILSEVITNFRRLRGQPESGDAAEINSFLPPDTGQGGPTAGQPDRIPDDLLETFRQEAEELLHGIGDFLRDFDRNPSGKQALLDVRRNVHTLKGAAGSVGMTELSKLAHRMEDLLDKINDSSAQLSPEIRSLLFATFDALEDMAGGTAVKEQVERLYERYSQALGAVPAARSARPPAPKTPDGESDAENIPADLLDAFRHEAEDHLQNIGDGLRNVERNPERKESIQEVRRTVHTLKGAAGMVGLRRASGLAHRMEDLLDSLFGQAVDLTPDVQSLLYTTTDVLSDLLSGAEVEGLEERLGQVYARYAELIGEAPVESPAPSAPAIKIEPLGQEKVIDLTEAMARTAQQEEPAEEAGAASAYKGGQFVRVPIERLDELVRLVSELLVNRSTFEQHLSAYAQEVEELGLSIGRLKRISSRLDADFEVRALKGGFGQLAVRGIVAGSKAAPTNSGTSSGFDALEFDQYTDFHLISRALNETTSDLSAAAGELANRIGDFDGYLNRLGRLTGEAQDKLMRVRMVPLLTLATRLHRTVRVTAESRNKRVDLVIEGEQVNLDKTVLEEMAGPLEHLLRNAVDHGIESDSMRSVIGTNVRGQIKLRAYHEGTQVVIEVADDGGGMEPDLIRAAAARMGFYSEAEAEQLSGPELYDLVFQPGFSTAREVSEVSGRGVGLDIVKATVNKLKGTIRIETEPGRGTKFTIRLPMTLAIIRVLLVKSNGETFAIPLGTVNKILRIEPKQIERIGKQAVIRVDGEAVPATQLGEALGLKSLPDASVVKQPVLVLQIGAQKLALIVDHLMEAREVVVKTMGNLLRRVKGITGATLMGDGSVVLIVNPAEIAQKQSSEAPSSSAPKVVRANPSRALDVLIVDDSISVRRVLTNLVESSGWTATSAKDGLDALDVLQRGKRPDVILLDIEMPRMDGYELTAALRAQETYKTLPIVMLTSRAGEKHRRRAFELGATDYLVKPYQEDTLLTVMKRVVREAKEATEVPAG